MQLIDANWPSDENIVCFTTTRLAGSSQGQFKSFNTALHVGDAISDVELNRARLLSHCQLENGQWLHQTHGVVSIKAQVDQQVVNADACWTDAFDLACIVMTADCLPVAFRDTSHVGVAHAGWRGLLNGVLENSLQSFDLQHTEVWLGPAIGPAAFEVGEEVRELFMNKYSANIDCFVPSPQSGKWLANLYQLARLRLVVAGIDMANIYGGEHCTFSDKQQFYSYRREPITGRMATVIYRTIV